MEERLRKQLSLVLASKDMMKTPMIRGELPLVPTDLSTVRGEHRRSKIGTGQSLGSNSRGARGIYVLTSLC